MIWAQFAVLLLKFANGILARLDRNELVRSGMDQQILAERRELDRTIKRVRAIVDEPSSPQSDLDELR